MEISRPNAQALTPEEQQQLDQLKVVVEQVIADGVLTREERDRIVALMAADAKITPQELDLVRTLIREKAATGEVVLDYSW